MILRSIQQQYSLYNELVDSSLKVTDRTTKLMDSPSKPKDRADFALSLFFRNWE